jgi:endonuclease/exonuclease/phosphatase family metal-dependent hydrolase
MILLLVMACAKEPASGELSVLTYNVHGLPPEITGDDTAGRMELIAPLLPQYDILGLQEDWDEENSVTLRSECDHETNERFSEKLNTDRAYGAGVDVLARFPTVDVFKEHYTTCYGTLDGASDCLASKGLLGVRIALAEGVELDVYTTHFEAGGGPDDDASRANHVEQLIDALSTWSDGRAVLFTGDTNLDLGDPDDDPHLTRLLSDETGLLDACLETGCPDETHIDRIWYRGSDTLELTATAWADSPDFYDASGVPLSDHPAITAVLSWSSPE